MIKWEKPMLISLSGATEALGACEPAGSGDSVFCRTGNIADGKCDQFGNAALGDCISGPNATGHCGAGN